MVENGATPVTFDLTSQLPMLDVLSNAIWLYDAMASKNLWGNIAALDLFGVNPGAFKAHQPSICADALHKFKPDAWAAANTKLQEDVQQRGLRQQVKVERSSGDSPPGFLPLPAKWESVSATYAPVQVVDGGAPPRTVVLIQAFKQKAQSDAQAPSSCGASRSLSLERRGSGVKLERQSSAARRSRLSGNAGDNIADGTAPSASCGACGCSCSVCAVCTTGEDARSAYEKRLTEMCDNHALFNFLFDERGELLAANKRAMDNMREHLGEHASYNLKHYLSIGEFDVAVSVDTMYTEAMRKIFAEGETCYRFPQMRWSKRHPGKSRWVLYEMWPINDPITGQPAVLVTEQNISQVKSVEEQYSKQMQRLEAQLEEAQEALAAKAERTDPWSHLPKIDIDTPAEKTLKLLERLLGGTQVSQAEAEELRDAILQATDLSQPVNLDEKLLSGTAAMYEQEVGASLLQLLSTRNMAKESDDHPVTPVRAQEASAGGGSNGGSTTSSGSHALGLPSSYYYSTSCGNNSSGSNAIGRVSISGSNPNDVGMALDGVLVAGHGTLAGFGDNAQGNAECAQNGTHNAVKELLAVVRAPPTPEMELVLAKVEEWQFDSFQLERFIGGRPLSLLAFYLIKRSELISKFDLDEARLARFLIRAEEGYPNNPYHNRMHAADVLRSTHVLATRGGLVNTGYCDDMALLACYLAAIMHDFEHRGVNNDFLVRTADPLAILYNDRSPMENHHLAAAFQLLSCDEFNFLKRLPHKTRESLRKLVIDMVLATDMKQHFAITGNFTSKLNHNISNSARTSGAGAGPAAMAAAKGRTPSNNQARHTEDDPVRKLPDEENRSLTLQVMLKCADLGHLATPAAVHRQWVQCLEEEFFRQGDREKAAGLTVSPLMDRDKAGITKSQVGFFDIVALPLFQSFSQKFPEAEPLLAAVKENYEMWKDESPSPVAPPAAGSGGSFSTAASVLSNGRTGSGLLAKAHSSGGLLALRTTSSAGGAVGQATA